MEVRDIADRHTFTISLPSELAAEVDRVAEREHRSRSELFREAFRLYVRHLERWDAIFAYGEAKARELGITSEQDVDRILAEYKRDRQEQRERRAATG